MTLIYDSYLCLLSMTPIFASIYAVWGLSADEITEKKLSTEKESKVHCFSESMPWYTPVQNKTKSSPKYIWELQEVYGVNYGFTIESGAAMKELKVLLSLMNEEKDFYSEFRTGMIRFGSFIQCLDKSAQQQILAQLSKEPSTFDMSKFAIQFAQTSHAASVQAFKVARSIHPTQEMLTATQYNADQMVATLQKIEMFKVWFDQFCRLIEQWSAEKLNEYVPASLVGKILMHGPQWGQKLKFVVTYAMSEDRGSLGPKELENMVCTYFEKGYYERSDIHFGYNFFENRIEIKYINPKSHSVKLNRNPSILLGNEAQSGVIPQNQQISELNGIFHENNAILE